MTGKLEDDDDSGEIMCPMDWTHSKRQLSTEGDNGRKDGREERKRKA